MACLVIIIRRIDLVTYPQFWAEDGTIWFATAYNFGWWPAIITPMVGYLQTISRLVGGISHLLPLAYAPLFFNLVAVLIRALPVMYLFSDRWYKILPNFWFKIVLALIYLFLPNTAEVHANITNAHWFLALILLMVLFGELSTKKYVRILEAILLLVASVSGPFSVFLLPIIFLAWFWLPQKRNLINITIISFGAIVQMTLIVLFGFSTRSHMILGATPWLFVKIFSGQLVLGSLIGKVGYDYLYTHFLIFESWIGIGIYLSSFVFGVTAIGLTLWKGKKELRLIVLFGLVVLIFSLLKPMASTSLPQWQVMAIPGAAGRYWFFPMLSFVLSLLYLTVQKNWPRLKVIALLVCLLWIWGLKTEGILRAWPNLNFKEQAKIFGQLPSGAEMRFRVMPENWHNMVLKQR
mgnify:CR=1 FL=1